MATCDFCKKSFSSLKSLQTHIKSAKYCLKSRGENNTTFQCQDCKKYFSSNQILQEHLLSCKEKLINEKNSVQLLYEEKLKEKDNYIKKLEEKIEKLEDALITINKPTTQKNITNNNTTNIVVNNFLDLKNIENIQKILENHMTCNVLCNGQKGLAKMVYEKLLKDEKGNLLYKCTDPSRQKFEFIGYNGETEKDMRANKLKKALIESDVCKKAHNKGNELWTDDTGIMNSDKFNILCEKVLEIVNFEKDDKKFRTELTKLTFS